MPKKSHPMFKKKKAAALSLRGALEKIRANFQGNLSAFVNYQIYEYNEKKEKSARVQLHPVVSPQSMQTWQLPFCFTFMELQARHCAPVKPCSFAAFARVS